MPQQDAPTVKFQTTTQLVVEMVSVKDKNGAVIEGLTAKDFTVTENGVAQTIRFCEFQTLFLGTCTKGNSLSFRLIPHVRQDR